MLPGGIVYDGVFNNFFAGKAYCRIMEAEAERTYTAREAAQAMLDAGHTGPWIPPRGRGRPKKGGEE
jgi:hypothetical protein